MFGYLTLLFVGSVLAGPASVPPLTTAFYDATTAYPTGPTVLSDPTCAANCTYTASSARQYTWIKVPVTATITRGVAYVIVNNETNTTRTSTSYYKLPSGQKLPPTNSAGTKVQEMTVTEPVNGVWQTFATNITYPSVYTKYGYGYQWWGVVPTTTADAQPVCSWAPYYFSVYSTMSSTGSFLRVESTTTYSTTATSTHTAYHTVASGAFVNYTEVVPFGTAQPTPDQEDPMGYLYAIELAEPIPATGVPPGNTESVIQSCSFGSTIEPPGGDMHMSLAPVAAYETVSFLIETSTIHESGPASVSATPSTTSDLVKGLVGALSPTTTQSTAPAKQSSVQSGSSSSVSAAEVTAGGIKMSQDASSNLVVDGKTLQPGSSVTVGSGESAKAVALQTSGGTTRLAVGGSQTFDVPSPTLAVTQVPTVEPPPTTFAGATVSQNEKSEVVLGGQTLAPGTAVTIGSGSSAAVVEVKTSNGVTQLIAAGTTAILPTASARTDGAISSNAVFTVGGQTFSANSASQLVVDGQTLSKDAAITLGTGASTTVVALQTASNGHTQLIVGDMTTNLPHPTTSLYATTAGGATISLDLQSDLVINGKTLKPGSAVTIGTGLSHTTIALQTSSGMTALVINGKTTHLGNATVTASSSSSTGLGAVIIGGLTGPDSTTTTTPPRAAVNTPGAQTAAAPKVVSSSVGMSLLGLMGAFALALA